MRQRAGHVQVPDKDRVWSNKFHQVPMLKSQRSCYSRVNRCPVTPASYYFVLVQVVGIKGAVV